MLEAKVISVEEILPFDDFGKGKLKKGYHGI